MIFSDKRLKELGFETVPRSIVLLGLGPSHQSYVGEGLSNLNQPFAEEVWSINGGGAVFNVDRVFSLADLWTDVQKWPHWLRYLTRTKTPIYTSKAYPQFPSTIDYPLQELRQFIGFDLCFVNTGPMALAMAMALGIKEIWMFGIDYTYPNIHLAEQGGQAFAFLLGMCKERGIKFHLPHTTSMMGSCYQLKPDPSGNGKMTWSPYGYRDVTLEFSNAGQAIPGNQVQHINPKAIAADGHIKEDANAGHEGSPLRAGHGPDHEAEGRKAGELHAVQAVPVEGAANGGPEGGAVHVHGRKPRRNGAGRNHRAV